MQTNQRISQGNVRQNFLYEECWQMTRSSMNTSANTRGQQRQTHLRQQVAEAECARLQGTEAEIRSDLRRRQIPDKDRATPPQ